MNVIINKQIIDEIYSDSLKDELIKYINQIIDEELEKVNIDTDLIDSCIDALDELEGENYAPAFRVIITQRNILNYCKKHSGAPTAWGRLNKTARVAIIAAVLATSTITVNAAISAVTGYNLLEEINLKISQQMNDWGFVKQNDYDLDNQDIPLNVIQKSTTALATEITTAPFSEERVQAVSNAESTTKAETVHMTTAKAIANDVEIPAVTDPYDNNHKQSNDVKFVALVVDTSRVKKNYIYGEALTYDGITLKAKYSDNTVKPLGIEDCTYTKNIDMNVTADYTLEVSYKSCSVYIDITVRPNEETRYSSIRSTVEYDYLLTADGAYITRYKGNDSDIVLNSIDGYSVFAISSKAFLTSGIKSFESNTVKTIGNDAFADCKNLKSFAVPEIRCIGVAALQNCKSLECVTLGKGLEVVGSNALQNTGVSELTLPAAVKSIPDYLCASCSQLETVTLEGDVTDIGEFAFYECTSLSRMTNTSHIRNVGFGAFMDDSALTFDSRLENLENVGESAFAYCESIDFGTVGDNLKTLGASAFEYCGGITDVIIPSTIKVIPPSAFRNTPVTSITLNEGVEVIESNAFMSTKISSVILPTTLKRIGEYGMYSTRLYTVRFKGDTTEIAPTAFYMSKRVTVYAPTGSYPIKYAQENGARAVEK